MPRPFVHRLRVRYSECDPQGVVFNANYVTYFDVALTELWREAIGPYGEMLAAGADMVVAEVSARYLASAGFDDMLDIAVAPTRLGTTAMTTRLEVRRGVLRVVEGEIRHVFVDPATRRKRPIPEHVRRGLEPYLVSPAERGAIGAATRGEGEEPHRSPDAREDGREGASADASGEEEPAARDAARIAPPGPRPTGPSA